MEDSTCPPDNPVVCDSSCRELRSQFMYEVSHKDPKKGGAKPATLGHSMQHVDTASRGDPWMEDTNLDYVEPFAEPTFALQYFVCTFVKGVCLGGYMGTRWRSHRMRHMLQDLAVICYIV